MATLAGVDALGVAVGCASGPRGFGVLGTELRGETTVDFPALGRLGRGAIEAGVPDCARAASSSSR